MTGRADGAASRPRERGFVLLIVLWTLSLLALLVAYLVSAGRQESAMAANLRAAAVAEAAADGAVFEAAWQVFAGRWPPDGTAHAWRSGASAGELRVDDANGWINPNLAPAPLLRSLLHQIGVDDAHDVSLAAAICDYRTSGEERSPHGAKSAEYRAAGLPYGPSHAGFTSVDEIGLVLGMTPDILGLLRPHLSLWQESAITPDSPDPVVRRVLKDLREQHADLSGLLAPAVDMIVQITAHVRGPGVARFGRRAVMRVKPQAERDDPPYQILGWETPIE